MKHIGCVWVIVASALAGGCGPSIEHVFAMAPAPPRPDNCPLQLVAVDPMHVPETWQMLGTITVSGKDLDPVSQDVRDLVHPRACGMGGTSIAVWMNVVAENSGGSRITYMVLRPKPTTPDALPPPTAF